MIFHFTVILLLNIKFELKRQVAAAVRVYSKIGAGKLSTEDKMLSQDTVL
jgi:hypothetical protein